VKCVDAFFFTCLSTCDARAACFVFCSIFLTAYLYSAFFSHKFDRHLCHGAYRWTHHPAHMPRLLYHLHLHFNNPCVRVLVSKHVYAFSSSSKSIHTYHHIHLYVLCSIHGHLFVFFFLFHKSNIHLCHGAYWCTHNPAHMPRLLFHLYLHCFNSCGYVSKNVYAFPSSSISIRIYRYIHVYVLCNVLYL